MYVCCVDHPPWALLDVLNLPRSGKACCHWLRCLMVSGLRDCLVLHASSGCKCCLACACFITIMALQLQYTDQRFIWHAVTYICWLLPATLLVTVQHCVLVHWCVYFPKFASDRYYHTARIVACCADAPELGGGCTYSSCWSPRSVQPTPLGHTLACT